MLSSAPLKSAVAMATAATDGEAARLRLTRESVDKIRGILSSLGISFDAFSNDFRGHLRFQTVDKLRSVFPSREQSDFFVEMMWRVIYAEKQANGETFERYYAPIDARESTLLSHVAETVRAISDLAEKHARVDRWYWRKKQLEEAVAKSAKLLSDAHAIANNYGTESDCEERFRQTLIDRPDQWDLIEKLAAMYVQQVAVAKIMPAVVAEMTAKHEKAQAELDSFLKAGVNPDPISSSQGNPANESK